jgi:deazaflavin-dependent oxidoreductase (nitroreductase family)
LRPLRAVAARVINPLTRRLAGWLPGFALLTHVGRRSGRTYRTPLNVFRRGDDDYIPLTFGPDVDWVRNVRAAGEAELRAQGRTIRLVAPEFVVDPDLRVLPVVPRVIERWNGATSLMRMRAATR